MLGLRGAAGGGAAVGLLLCATAATIATAVALPEATTLLLVAGAAARLGRGRLSTSGTTRGGGHGAGSAPAQAGAAGAGGREEGGVGDGFLIMSKPGLLEHEHVVGAGERREDGGVGDVVHGAGEARLKPTKHGEDELAALDGVADGAEFCSLQLEALTVLRDGGVANCEGSYSHKHKPI